VYIDVDKSPRKQPGTGSFLYNDMGHHVALGARCKYYCGRKHGNGLITGPSGTCGPLAGPQCPSCQRFQEQIATNAEDLWPRTLRELRSDAERTVLQQRAAEAQEAEDRALEFQQSLALAAEEKAARLKEAALLPVGTRVEALHDGEWIIGTLVDHPNEVEGCAEEGLWVVQLDGDDRGRFTFATSVRRSAAVNGSASAASGNGKTPPRTRRRRRGFLKPRATGAEAEAEAEADGDRGLLPPDY